MYYKYDRRGGLLSPGLRGGHQGDGSGQARLPGGLLGSLGDHLPLLLGQLGWDRGQLTATAHTGAKKTHTHIYFVDIQAHDFGS